MFALDPDQSTRKFPFFHDVWENQFLFWSVVIGALRVFPAIYIIGLNTEVFEHKGISWEWATAIVFVLIFVSGVELWKLVKRNTGWFADHETEGLMKNKAAGVNLSLRQGFFSFARTRTRTSDNTNQEARVESKVLPSTAKEEV